jgi:hypothetical protein
MILKTLQYKTLNSRLVILCSKHTERNKLECTLKKNEQEIFYDD